MANKSKICNIDNDGQWYLIWLVYLLAMLLSNILLSNTTLGFWLSLLIASIPYVIFNLLLFRCDNNRLGIFGLTILLIVISPLISFIMGFFLTII